VTENGRATVELSSMRRTLLEARLAEEGVDLAARIAPRTGSGPTPVSFAQERLWFLDQLEPGSVAYNVPVGVRLEMALDVSALRVAVAGLVGRHESLRTRFGVVDGRPVQLVEPRLEIDIPVVDLSGLGTAERDAEVARLGAVEAQRPFDLAAGPLLRVGLLRLAAADWVLLVTVHHIVSDAWSVSVLFGELTELYEAARLGRAPQLPELPIQYADYAAWQREWLTGDVLAEQVAYWRERLAGAPALLELPADHPRPAVQSFAGQAHAFELDQRLLDRLNALARGNNATLFMVLLAAFKTLLYRYSGQPDLVVGTPIANRTRAEIEGLIGFFTNTLALRTDLSGDPTYSELLAQIRDHTLAAYAHQDLPFERLVEELQPRRTLSHNPIFQVLFTLQNAPGTPTSSGDTQSVAGNGTAKFDLSLFAAESPTGLFCVFEYTTDLFEQARIERTAGHLRTLLEDIVADPDRPISQLGLLTAPERAGLLEPSAAIAASDTTLVHQLFEAHAASDPDRPALLHNGQRVGYGELNERANQLAHTLQGQGVGPDRPVAVCLDRGPDQLTAMLAVLKAGGAYLPIDPNYPPERVAFMLDDSNAQIVITDPTPAPDQPTTNLTTTTQPDNLAYIIYTSGSTGQPKATTLPHRLLSNLVAWQIRTSNLPAGARTLQFAPSSFDVSVQECFATLCDGGELVVIDDDDRRDPRALRRVIADAQVTRAFLPWSAIQQLAADADHGTQTASLTQIITAGEQPHITPAVAAMFARMPSCALHNQYGPAETHVVTAHVLRGAPAAWPALPTIGCAIQNVEALILDEALQPVPEGIPGELCIGGIGLARGYLNQPALTAQKFVPHPHTTSPGARLYRTGDRARRHHNGTIEFLGRQDNQIKIRGFRIEPGEIETLLTQHPAIRECAVTAREDTPGDRRLTAYLTPTTPTHTTTPDQLRSHLQTKLPAYMIPTNYVWITNLPLTPNGKLDHKKLPAPTPQNPLPHNTYTPPTTPTQTTLTKIWQDVLGINHIGTHDNFFDLGGHSLLATQVTSRIRTTLNYDLPLRQLFEHPTIHTLATTIVEAVAERVVAEGALGVLDEIEQLSDGQANQLLEDR
jgi:amino acid adenylation domain-containing protein